MDTMMRSGRLGWGRGYTDAILNLMDEMGGDDFGTGT